MRSIMKKNKFSIIKDGIPIFTGLLLTWILCIAVGYFFDVHPLTGLLFYIPLYFIDKKVSYTVKD